MHELLSTDERIKILLHVLERSLVGVEETAKATGLSKGLVSKTLGLLVKHGLAEKRGRKFKILNSPQKRELQRFLNFSYLYPKLRDLREEWMLSLGIYGSFARGENTPESDLDVWVLAERQSILKSASLKRKIEATTGREVNLLILTPKRLVNLRKKDPVFYYSLVYGSMVLWGEPLDRISNLHGKGSVAENSPLKGKRTVEH